jgi:hypothetical protein
MLHLDVRGQDEDRDLRHLLANRLRSLETFGRMAGWHPNVDDRKLWPMLTDEAQERRRVAGLTDDAVTGLREQTGKPFAKQEIVVSDDYGPPGHT